MTEEKRVIKHNGRCLYITKNWRDKKVLDGGYDSTGVYAGAEPIPMTKQEFIKLATNENLERYASTILHWYGAPDKEAMEKFWDRYSKPVSKKMWYVKVPHAHKTFYHKWFDSDVLGAQSVQGVYDQLNGLDNSCEFTEAEIKKFHLEDCKKVPVDG
ncbi:hypothetical protein [Lactobacillus sp. ESL0230]|uniref:hypothetical protein n=1 Tax=Lactobacillus sp. ESL0230 TaxID=2069353 RepID=UPI000EFAF8E5|nr:hypothetical protein [Lactobacillus sp. ESL0230]RMC46530.1 hypothetical protein F5ESL0230_04545 [Lactobacillus sp. ESL0230]